MIEKLEDQNELKPQEIAYLPRDFDWREEAWFAGSLHSILRLNDKTEWISKTVKDKGCWNMPPKMGFVYQIIPFVFWDEAAREATGTHFVIPEGGFSNRVLIAKTDFRIRTRIVSGAGWLSGKSPLGGEF